MDIILLFICIASGVILLAEATTGDNHPLVLLIWVVLVVWLIAMASTSKTVANTNIYPIQTLEQNGQTYQVYLNNEGTIRNVTEKFNRFFPEGSVIKEINLEDWHLGCYCIFGKRSIEVWTPNDEEEMIKFPTAGTVPCGDRR